MVKVLATDIDGTITIDRTTTMVDTDVIKYMRALEKKGVYVVLVSANALPIVVGLKKYFGLKGPCIGESGSLVFMDGKIYSLTNRSAANAAKDIEKLFSECIYPSWQNAFRLHDYAFHVRKECINNADKVINELREYIRKHYPDIKVGYSGYAIHLTPVDVSKEKALSFIAEKLGYSLEDFVAIGDSVMDKDMVEAVGFGVAVANADEELKKVAKYVTRGASSKGFIELAQMILEGRLG
ncbi:phosphoglycolate phosphatase [Desulfurococcaceae archaeon MEX13E-LK6-19]|nr:phosphoglycolate phosphatase [Desulfurococcaceae archaeon MEX13E-LK6-19]